jgi:hypothetical protein
MNSHALASNPIKRGLLRSLTWLSVHCVADRCLYCRGDGSLADLVSCDIRMGHSRDADVDRCDHGRAMGERVTWDARRGGAERALLVGVRSFWTEPTETHRSTNSRGDNGCPDCWRLSRYTVHEPTTYDGR